jgi:hypothetical protein
MTPCGLTHTLVASVTTAPEATMHDQLTYIIAKQHHAELVRNAERARLIADAKRDARRGSPRQGLRSFRGRVTAAVVHRTASAARDAS